MNLSVKMKYMKYAFFFVALVLTASPAISQQPSPTPLLYSEKTLADMSRLQQAASVPTSTG